jgi:hypothetical protein
MSEPTVHGSTKFAADQYTAASGQTSTIVRSLALSAIAVIWLFSGGLTPKDATPQRLLQQIQDAGWLQVGLIAALASLVLDLLHYVWATCCWGGFHRALDGVLERDDGAEPLSGDVEKVWNRAARWKIVDQIEQLTGTSGYSQTERLTQARTALHLAERTLARQPALPCTSRVKWASTSPAAFGR